MASPMESSNVRALRTFIGNCVAAGPHPSSSSRIQLPSAPAPPPPLLLPPSSDKEPAFPITPPTDDQDPETARILETATHVLSVETNALAHLSRLYATDPVCRDGFVRAVEAIVDSQAKGGKTCVVGVGKSGKIGDKVVATMNSLGVCTVLLNPVDALHGDLGVIRPVDVILLITFSGKTPELLQLLPHLPQQLPLIALTAHNSYHTSPLTRGRESAILLPAPIPESEVQSFGLAAPTSSTTIAMALGDALSLAVARRIHNTTEGYGPAEVFKKNHPGGAIGQVNNPQSDASRLRSVVVTWDEMPTVDTCTAGGGGGGSANGTDSPALSESSTESDVEVIEWPGAVVTKKELTVLDCLRFAVKSPKGWLTTRDGGVIPPKRLMSFDNVAADVRAPELDLVVDVSEQIRYQADSTIKDVRRKLYTRRANGELTNETVVVVEDNGRLIGAVEVGTIIEQQP